MKTHLESALLEKVRQELESKLSMLISRTKKIDADLSRPTDEDWEERAVELEDDDVLSSLGNATMGEIRQIRRAIQQIDAGTYGICTHCESPIAADRLELLPYATSCIQCSTVKG